MGELIRNQQNADMSRITIKLEINRSIAWMVYVIEGII